MDNPWRWFSCALAIGIGATALLDAWAWSLRRFGISSLDWCLAGRWMGHSPRGRFVHESIGHATPVKGECLLGWGLHYASGIAFAALLLALAGSDWAQRPTLAPALAVGLGTVILPFFVMQPGMGAGIAASKTPDPTRARARARLRSLLAHAVFGVGMYVSSWIVAASLP
ncbi:DUF2938 domain-containing protein [Lysobacter cavernae]|uniref:DUF2938 domain-containing protein n=1 Tax=Lysobacter cavernae TaxID=1685901 RepID=A0ABV7RQL2_9GAMM